MPTCVGDVFEIRAAEQRLANEIELRFDVLAGST